MSEARSAPGTVTPSRPGRLRKRVLLSGVAALSAVLALLALEIGFRLMRAVPWYERIVQAQKRADGVKYPVGDLTSLQLRKMPPKAEKQPGTCRILFLGDSFTYGSGMDDASKVFVKLVEKKLNAWAPGPGIDRVEAFNGGIPGSLTAHWVKLFRSMAGAFRPDLVVAVFFLRDGVDASITSMQLIRDIEEGMNRLEQDSLLYRWSALYRFFRQRSEFHSVSRAYLEAIRKAYEGSEEETAEWRLARENLLRIQQQTEQGGGRFALVIFPVLLELNDGYPLQGVCDIVQRFCEEHGIPALSLLPAFMHRDASELWISLYDQHPNEEGHAIAAEAITPFIESLLRPPRWKEPDRVAGL